jgi:hypothetical protein
MPAFGSTFEDLKRLFVPYIDRLTVTVDSPSQFMLDGTYSDAMKRPMFFGGVRAGKSYVSFYLMPVYSNPELLGKISDALRRRMQGKSCFNFVSPEPELYDELRQLTARGFACYERLGYVK